MSHESVVLAGSDVNPLETSLGGTLTIRVVVVTDANHNGQFDRRPDQSCRRDGSVVEAGRRRIDHESTHIMPTSTPFPTAS